MNHPSCVPPVIYDVTAPTIYPVLAEPGQCVVVRHDHPTRPLVVVGRDADGDWHPIRRGTLDLDAVATLVRDGVWRVSAPLPALAPDPLPARSA